MSALIAAAVMAVLAPLGRAPGSAVRSGARQVYLDQMGELDRDAASGKLSAEDARSIRAEVGRRILQDGGDVEPPPFSPDRPWARRTAAILAIVGIPAVSLGLYLMLGAPQLPGQPLVARLQAPSGQGEVDALLSKVEAHLASSPEDGAGWEVVAPVYLRLGRGEDAAAAFRNAIRILGTSAKRQEGLGQALFAVEQGIVSADARAAFEAAHAADPAAPGARYFLALAKAQEGDRAGAEQEWRALLADAPADAAWRPAVEQALQQAAPGAAPGTEAVASKADGSDAERAAMIEGMVSSLAARLEREPDDVEGWLRLVRSYVVLGRPRDASQAARKALQSLPRAEDRGRVESLVADLGVDTAGTATR